MEEPADSLEYWLHLSCIIAVLGDERQIEAQQPASQATAYSDQCG